MLIAMTFNGYIIIAIVLGGIFGHFFSTWDTWGLRMWLTSTRSACHRKAELSLRSRTMRQLRAAKPELARTLRACRASRTRRVTPSSMSSRYRSMVTARAPVACRPSPSDYRPAMPNSSSHRSVCCSATCIQSHEPSRADHRTTRCSRSRVEQSREHSEAGLRVLLNDFQLPLQGRGTRAFGCTSPWLGARVFGRGRERRNQH